MEVTLKAGDSLNIPEGCKAVIKDNVVVFEREEKEEVQDFKDGDVLHSVYADITLIFEKYSTCYSFTSHYSTLNAAGFDWAVKSFRHATKEEKSEFFDKMKEQGLQWNAEKKRLEKIRWRAGVGEEYYFINSSLDVLKIEECWSVLCGEHYLASNYFRTQEQAKEAAKRVKETLRKYHEEIGE